MGGPLDLPASQHDSLLSTLDSGLPWDEDSYRQVRGGWAMDGRSPDGGLMKSFPLIHEGAEEARVLLDDFEVCE